METYNYDPSAQAGSEARTAENESAVYHRPGSGSVSDPNTAPGFGPAGPVTPSLPGNTGGCINCGPGQGGLSNLLGNVLWAWILPFCLSLRHCPCPFLQRRLHPGAIRYLLKRTLGSVRSGLHEFHPLSPHCARKLPLNGLSADQPGRRADYQ